MCEDSKWTEINIETFVGELDDSMSTEEMQACRKKLVVLHELGDNKEALIKQLETMIDGIKTDFENFVS